MKKPICFFLFISIFFFSIAEAQFTKVGEKESVSGFNLQKVVLDDAMIKYKMDFEDAEDFSLTFDPWSVNDIDGENTYGFLAVDFPNEHEPMSFIAFKPSGTNPPVNEQSIQPYEGLKFGACFASMETQNNDWLITPLINLGTGSYLSFRVKSYTNEFGLEQYNVAVSTETNSPDDFTIISGATPKEAPFENWIEDYYDLTDYNDQAVYIAIQCVSEQKFIFMVDDIEIFTEETGIYETVADEVEIFPNPASDMVFFNASSVIDRIVLYNTTGEVVRATEGHQTNLSVNDLKTGIYYYVLRFRSSKTHVTGKLLIRQ